MSFFIKESLFKEGKKEGSKKRKKEEKEGRKRGRKEKRKTRNRQFNHNWSKCHAKSAYTSPCLLSLLHSVLFLGTEQKISHPCTALYCTAPGIMSPFHSLHLRSEWKMFKVGLCETACMRRQTSGLKSRRSV